MRPFFRKHTLVDFLHIFLEQRKMTPYYNGAYNKLLDAVYEDDRQEPSDLEPDKVFLVYDIPDYLQMQSMAMEGLKHFKINTFKGSLMLLKQYSDLEDLLHKKFSAKRRSQFRGYYRKLNHCFAIDTKFYYGDIGREEYDRVFDIFYEMLNSRFLEKETENEDLPHWDKYREIIFPLINEKKACLSVIYDEDRPISISLNLVYQSMVFGYMKSYDIDYSKFGLGFIDLINLLEWCYAKGIESFDFLKGEYDYKGRWTDHEYNFQKHVLYRSRRFFPKLYGSFLAFRINAFYKIMGTLKKMGLHLAYNSLKKVRYRVFNTKQMGANVNFSVEKLQKMPSGHELAEVDLNNNQFSHLKRPFYSCLYSSGERKSDTKLFSISDEPERYVFQGKESMLKLSLLR